MKDPNDLTCDYDGCECLATIDMVVIAPCGERCEGCGRFHTMARIGLFLYLCEQHAQQCDGPLAFLDPETLGSVDEAFATQGFGRPDFSLAFWEYSSAPKRIAYQLN